MTVPAYAWFLFGLVVGQLVFLLVLAFCSMAADDPRWERRPW